VVLSTHSKLDVLNCRPRQVVGTDRFSEGARNDSGRVLSIFGEDLPKNDTFCT